MIALTVEPRTKNNARLEEVPEPPAGEGSVLVEALAVGLCGTDRDILEGHYGSPPPGERRLILGHEAVGRVIEAIPNSGLNAGDLVVPMVRRPDPVPCASCAAGEWDMCRNGRYTEHGIKQRHGFAAERWRLPPDALVLPPAELGELAVLVEPASIIAKAWDHIESIGARSLWQPSAVLVTGAGPIGLLAALQGIAGGFDVTVLDHNTGGPKPELTRDLGARYISDGLGEAARQADIIIECTGAPDVVLGAIASAAPNAIVCLTGVSGARQIRPVDVAAFNRDLVLENNVVFGTVNANRAHYEMASHLLADAPRDWLERLISRRVPLADWPRALEKQKDDVKVVINVQ
ncbi:MAG TPA: glucose 1-dehydrogenase [Reyranella sp.]|nr:glucose 1-dehydrogenase [Reyranella sp.]